MHQFLVSEILGSKRALDSKSHELTGVQYAEGSSGISCKTENREFDESCNGIRDQADFSLSMALGTTSPPEEDFARLIVTLKAKIQK